MMNKKLVLALAGVALMAGHASAEEVQATKTAPAASLFPDAYGSISIYHETDLRKDANYANASRALFADYILGSKLFGGKGDINLTLEAYGQEQSVRLQRGTTTLNTSYKLLDMKYASITPYADAYLAPGASDATGDAGAAIFAKASELETVVGKVSVKGGVDTRMALSNGDSTVSVPTTGLGLADVSEPLVVKKDRDSYNADSILKASLVPSAANKLTISAEAKIYNKYVPVYVAEVEDGAAVAKFDGYSRKQTARLRTGVSYKTSETTSISNTLDQYWTGAYESPSDANLGQAPRYINYLSFDADLF
jgi:hypothetical protein